MMFLCVVKIYVSAVAAVIVPVIVRPWIHAYLVDVWGRRRLLSRFSANSQDFIVRRRFGGRGYPILPRTLYLRQL